MTFAVRFVASAVLVVLTACGESSPPPQSPSAETPKKASTGAVGGNVATPPKPVTTLRRAEVKETIARGLGMFLQNVTVDDWPVMREGKFHGFKIKTLNPEWGVDLRAGDVVTRVNGIVPEHPEEADAALRALEKAPSLKVDFEREGKSRTLELPIVD